MARNRSRSAASRRSWSASPRSNTKGFSTRSGTPARISWSVGAKWCSFGSATVTRSGWTASSMAAMSVKPAVPASAACRRVRSSSLPTIATTVVSSRSEKTRMCCRPQPPGPTTATRRGEPLASASAPASVMTFPVRRGAPRACSEARLAAPVNRGCQSSSVMRSNGASSKTPTLLTRMSTSPSRSRSRRTCEASAKSAAIPETTAPGTSTLELAHCLLHAVGAPAVDDDGRALAEQCAGDRVADALRRAAHEGTLARQLQIHAVLTSCRPTQRFYFP